MVSKYTVGKLEREMSNSSCPVEKDVSEEIKVLNGLMCVACLLQGLWSYPTWDAAMGCVWVPDPATAAVNVDVCGSYYHKGHEDARV